MPSRESTMYGLGGLVAVAAVFSVGFWYRGYRDQRTLETEPKSETNVEDTATD